MDMYIEDYLEYVRSIIVEDMFRTPVPVTLPKEDIRTPYPHLQLVTNNSQRSYSLASSANSLNGSGNS